ncbi:MAG TPA: glutaredoxin domain-containing protein [Candidatus Magasanikbacteria bacterium]|nr:glutaredoxin domain-containing protein [Candidatus Magasanikbacteria bacterium]
MINIYSTPSCPYCHMVKDYLKSKNISFTDYNVAEDHDKAQEMIEKSGQMGVPVVEIDNNIIVGFDKPEIDRLLNL